MKNTVKKNQIKQTFSDVRALSFSEKKNQGLDDERMNLFLDAILEVKSYLKDKTETIYNINERIESITWLGDLDEDCLMILNDLISVTKDLHTSLIRQYISCNKIRSRGIAKDEIKEFKNSIDELKEAYEDLESVFFFLPKIPGFKETTKQLSLI